MEAGLGWRLGGLAADDLGMAVLVQLSPRKLKVVCQLPRTERRLSSSTGVEVGLDFFRVSSIVGAERGLEGLGRGF